MEMRGICGLSQTARGEEDGILGVVVIVVDQDLAGSGVREVSTFAEGRRERILGKKPKEK